MISTTDYLPAAAGWRYLTGGIADDGRSRGEWRDAVAGVRSVTAFVEVDGNVEAVDVDEDGRMILCAGWPTFVALLAPDEHSELTPGRYASGDLPAGLRAYLLRIVNERGYVFSAEKIAAAMRSDLEPFDPMRRPDQPAVGDAR